MVLKMNHIQRIRKGLYCHYCIIFNCLNPFILKRHLISFHTFHESSEQLFVLMQFGCKGISRKSGWNFGGWSNFVMYQLSN